MFTQRQGIGIGLGAAVFAAGLWLGSIDRSAAQTVPPVGGQNMRYLLTTASEGSIFMIDTANGDTWTLTTDNAPRVPRHWVKFDSLSRVRTP